MLLVEYKKLSENDRMTFALSQLAAVLSGRAVIDRSKFAEGTEASTPAGTDAPALETP